MSLTTRSKFAAVKIYIRWEICDVPPYVGSMQPRTLCTPDWHSINADNSLQSWSWPEDYVADAPYPQPRANDIISYSPWGPRDPGIYDPQTSFYIVYQIRKNLVTNEEQLRYRVVQQNKTTLFARTKGGDQGWYYATGAGAGWEHGETIQPTSSFLSNAGWPTPPMPSQIWDNSVGGFVPITSQQIANWPGSWNNATVTTGYGHTDIGSSSDSQIQHIHGYDYEYWRIESTSYISDGYYMQSSGSNTNPTAGTLLSTFCNGNDQYGTYADGSGGTYNQLIQANSSACMTPSSPTSTVVKGILGCQITTFKAGANWGSITPSPVPTHPTIDLTKSFFS